MVTGVLNSGLGHVTTSTGHTTGGVYPPSPSQLDRIMRGNVEAYMKSPNAEYLNPQAQHSLLEMISQQDRQFQILGKKLPNGVTPTEMIRLRMHIPEREMIPFPHIHAVVHEDTVVVFVVTASGEPVTFKDELVMFPTDGLIAKLNLLRA